MGIKNLHQILQQYAEKCYSTKSLSDYAFKKVGIDISLYLYKFKATLGNNWLGAFISLISCLRKWDIHSFFIYDGKAPIEKLVEQQRRRESLAKQGDRVKNLEKEIEEYEKEGKVGEMIKEICKKEAPPQALFIRTSQPEVKVDIEVVKERVETLKSMIISITEDDIKLTKELFDILRVPYTTAPDEAERFASHLCVHGKIDAVLSEDTDVLAYGTPLFLTKIDIYKNTVVELKHPEILECVEMSRDSFTDLCIMCGCDYNDNIYGYGWKKCYDLIKSNETIEACIEEIKILEIDKKAKLQKKLCKEKDPEEKEKIQGKIDEVLDVEVLKYVRCRELFSIPNQVDFYAPFCGTPDFTKLEEFLFRNQISCNLPLLKKNLSPRTVIFEED
jgi:flap endonuclease-1